MAIIYTYPRLANPQGNELIVVSDVNNKNATRLVTIDSIASLVPSSGGDGCSTSISTLITPNGTLNVSSCDAPVKLTSADGSVDISAPGANNINIQAGCVTTYVLKPVVCDGGEAISTNANDWIFSCNPQLAEFSSADYGSIQITNDGIQVGSEFSQCWDVSVWNPIGSNAEFECCGEPPSTAYLYNICSTSSGIDMPASLVLPTFEAPLVLVTDEDKGNRACYEFQQKGQVTPSTGNYTVNPLQQNQNCNTSPCIPSMFTNQFDFCSTSNSAIIVAELKQQAEQGVNFLRIYLDADQTANADYVQVLSTTAMSIPGVPLGSPLCYRKTASNTTEPATGGLTQFGIIPNATALDCDDVFEQGWCTATVRQMIRCVDEKVIYVPADYNYAIGDVYSLTFPSGTQPGTGVERSTLNGCYTASNVLQNTLDGIPSSILPAGEKRCDATVCLDGEEKWVYYECENTIVA